MITRSPSKAASSGSFIPLPVSVARTAPVEARTTVAPEWRLRGARGTQMFAPSKTGTVGRVQTVTVWRIAPVELSFRRVLALMSVTQTFDPSKTTPKGVMNPAVTVVTVQGIEAPGVTIETEPVRIRSRSRSAPRRTSRWLARSAEIARHRRHRSGRLPRDRSGKSLPGRSPPGHEDAFPPPRAPQMGAGRPAPRSRSPRRSRGLARHGSAPSPAPRHPGPSKAGWPKPAAHGRPIETAAFCGVQNWPRSARPLPRRRTPSTVRDRNAAICRRVDVGPRVVGRRRRPARDPEGEDLQHERTETAVGDVGEKPARREGAAGGSGRQMRREPAPRRGRPQGRSRNLRESGHARLNLRTARAGCPAARSRSWPRRCRRRGESWNRSGRARSDRRQVRRLEERDGVAAVVGDEDPLAVEGCREAGR